MFRIKLLVATSMFLAVLLAACGAKSPGEQVNMDGSVNVTVSLKGFSIESSVKEFKPGAVYHFTVTNDGQVPHEFMIMPVSEHMGMSGMKSMEQWDKIALMMIPAEQLPAGATAKADYTFANVPEGNIELVCMTPGHFEAGMHTPIRVK